MRRVLRIGALVTGALAIGALLVGALLVSAPAASADGVTVSPSDAPLKSLTQFTVTGTVPAEVDTGEVSVAFNGVTVGTAFTSETDQYQESFPIPPADGPGAAQCGPNAVTVTTVNLDGPDAQVGSATLTADCPAITVTPATVANQQLPATFDVTPSGFPLPGGFQLAVDGAPQSFTAVPGGLDFTASPACGAHQVTLSQIFGEQVVSASAQITVQCSALTPTLTINPAVLRPGTLTQVTATGFAPGRPVTLTWQLPGGLPLLGTLTVTPDGDGAFSTFFMVMPHDLLGVRKLVAAQGDVKATANAVVDGGTMQPSSSKHLDYRR